MMINPALANAFSLQGQSDRPESKLDYITNMINIMSQAQQAQQAYAPQHEYNASPYRSLYEPQEEEEQASYHAPQKDYYGTISERGQLPHTKGSSLANVLGKRESNNNYKSVNTLGFSGKYQMGSRYLEDAGLLRPGASKGGNKALNNPENWTIPGGKAEFLANPAIQEAAYQKMTKKNQLALVKAGIITKDTPKNVVNGYLAAMHLGGLGGVKKMLRGKDTKDAYGTKISDYFRMGANAEV